MFKLVGSETLDLTPALVEKFHDLEPSPTERAINPGRMKMLRSKAENEPSLLITFHWAKAIVKGKEYRVNGQHSEELLTNLNGKFPTGLKVHLDTYECETIDDLALLFRQFDERKSARSVVDVAGAYQGLVEELRAVPRDTAKLGLEGVAWYMRFVEDIAPPASDDLYAWFNRKIYHPFLLWLPTIFDIKTKEMRQVGVLAAMYGALTKSETGAKEFFAQVARGGVEYEENAPSTVLDAWLKAYAEAKRSERVKRSSAAFYSGTVYAYNAFRRGKTLRDIICDTKKGLPPVAD